MAKTDQGTSPFVSPVALWLVSAVRMIGPRRQDMDAEQINPCSHPQSGRCRASLRTYLPLLLLLLLLLLLFITFMQGIYNYLPETNHVSGVYSIAAVL
jgi:hypothetical protein